MTQLADPRFEVVVKEGESDWRAEHGTTGPHIEKYRENGIRRVVLMHDDVVMEVIWLEDYASVAEAYEVAKRLFGIELDAHVVTGYGTGEHDTPHYLTIYLDA